MPTPKFVLASLENALIAYLTSFVGLLLASGNAGINVSDLRAAALAGVPAGLSVIYSMLAGLKTGTASLVVTPPAATVAPVAPVVVAPVVQDTGASLAPAPTA
jgi:hypothetical protein